MKWKIIIFVMGVIIMSNLINAYYFSCNQNLANQLGAIDGNCGLNYTGSNTWTGSAWSTPNNGYDANWNTKTNTTMSGDALYFRFFKPSYSFASPTNAIWEIKYLNGLYDYTNNYSIDANNCLNQNPVNLSIVYTVCFAKNSKVIIASTNQPKNIQDVVIGDIIISYNESKQQLSMSRVIGTEYHPAYEDTDGYYVINNILNVTGEHPIYSNGQWIRADSLKLGDNLTWINGSSVPIISYIHINQSIETYNLEVNDTHNYYVSNYLVHNKGSPIYNFSCTYNGGKVNLGGFIGSAGSMSIWEGMIIWNVSSNQQNPIVIKVCNNIIDRYRDYRVFGLSNCNNTPYINYNIMKK